MVGGHVRVYLVARPRHLAGRRRQQHFLYRRPLNHLQWYFSAEKGTSVLDQRHRAVFTAIFTTPNRKFDSAVANHLLNGWQLSLLGTFASAQYTTPTMLVSGVQFPGQAFTNTLNGFGGSNQVPFLSRQSIPIDSTQRVDSRLTKIVSLTERVLVNLNFEVFNTFNRVSNTFVTTQAYQASAGVIRPFGWSGRWDRLRRVPRRNQCPVGPVLGPADLLTG